MLINFINISSELFGIKLINTTDFAELLMRFLFNFGITLYLIRYIYYRKTNKRDYLFTFLLIGVVVFLMCFLLESVKLQLGFALGLFAVFGIIRYRTTTIPIKEMTYLFIVIGLSVLNALANKKVSYLELTFTNIAVLVITAYIERLKNLENESYANILFEKIELINPSHKEELMRVLEDRLGLSITRLEIGIVDYQKDVVKIKAYFLKSEQTWGENDDMEFMTNSTD